MVFLILKILLPLGLLALFLYYIVGWYNRTEKVAQIMDIRENMETKAYVAELVEELNIPPLEEIRSKQSTE